MKTEKIEGTKNEVYVVKQSEDDYDLYDGIHEAIVSEEIWYQDHAKRKLMGVRHEKTHSLEHFHILSGLLRRPVCGEPMYGVVNRKKKKDSEEYYTDMWYYKCKNCINAAGKPCAYRKYIRQGQQNAEMIELVKCALNDQDFKQRVTSRGGGKEGSALNDPLEERKRVLDEQRKTENKKNRLLQKIGNMDVDDDLYDTLCEDYRGAPINRKAGEFGKRPDEEPNGSRKCKAADVFCRDVEHYSGKYGCHVGSRYKNVDKCGCRKN